jgi:hypothetical protein
MNNDSLMIPTSDTAQGREYIHYILHNRSYMRYKQQSNVPTVRGINMNIVEPEANQVATNSKQGDTRQRGGNTSHPESVGDNHTPVHNRGVDGGSCYNLKRGDRWQRDFE